MPTDPKESSILVLNQGKSMRLQGQGLVLEPVDSAAEGEAGADAIAERLSQFGADIVHQKLNAYCIQFLMDVPVAGQVFRIAPPEAQQAYSSMRSVLSAGDRIRDALNPDSDPEGYFHSTRQWAIWTQERNLSREQFEEAFLEHTRKNVEASGQEWTDDIENLVRDLLPNRWADVQKVLAEAGDGS